MPRLALFVFLLVVAGLSTVDSKRRKRRCVKKWDGVCFGTQDTLYKRGIYKCDHIVYNDTLSQCPPYPPPGKPGESQACCVDCAKQTGYCEKRYAGSVGSGSPCCPPLLEVMKGRGGSGCVCCKECPPKSRKCKRAIKRGHAHCITETDPYYNVDWCLNPPPGVPPHPGVKIKKRGCKGNGCWCCIWDKPQPN